MFKGDISNKPQDVVLVDWDILIEPKISMSKISAEVFHNYILFGKQEDDLFSIRTHAKGWIERNYIYRMCLFTVGMYDEFRRFIEPIIYQLVPEVEHFDTKTELKSWLLINSQVMFALTKDKSLVSNTVKEFLGWGSIEEYR